MRFILSKYLRRIMTDIAVFGRLDRVFVVLNILHINLNNCTSLKNDARLI